MSRGQARDQVAASGGRRSRHPYRDSSRTLTRPQARAAARRRPERPAPKSPDRERSRLPVMCVTTAKPKAAAAARIGAVLGHRKRAELLELLRPCFARTEPWLQAGKYAATVMCDLRRRNGWTIAERSGDRAPDRTQRLLNRAVWDTWAAMRVVRRFAVAGLDEATRAAGRRRGLAVGAIDETGQVKAGRLSRRQAAVSRLCGQGGQRDQHRAPVLCPGGHRACAGRCPGMDPGRPHRRPGQIGGHGPAGGSGLPHQGPAGHRHPRRGVCRRRAAGLRMRRRGLWLLHRATQVPGGPRSGLRTAGPVQLPAGLARRGHADLQAGRRPAGQARLGGPLGRGRIEGTALVCLGVAGHRLGPASPADPPPPGHRRARLSLLLPARRPAGVPSRPVRAVGLRSPCEEDFAFGKDCFGLDQSQVHLYTAIARHTVLVMAAVAICASQPPCCAAVPAPRYQPRCSRTSPRPPTGG